MGWGVDCLVAAPDTTMVLQILEAALPGPDGVDGDLYGGAIEVSNHSL